MFTGIVEEIGKICDITKGRHSATLTIEANKVLEDAKIGDSIAVNGICLTVTSLPSGRFTADVMHETMNRTSMGKLRPGDRVGLERAMPVNGRFGGHIVAGHADGTGTIEDIRKDDNAIWYTVRTSSEIMKYIVEKGSVALDGISLTVAKVTENTFSISAIPHTVANTVLKDRQKGDMVNIENDIVGKYIEKLIKYDEGKTAGAENKKNAESGITSEFLMRHGF